MTEQAQRLLEVIRKHPDPETALKIALQVIMALAEGEENDK